MTARALLFLAAATGTAAAADWPQWRGPNRDGKSADTGLLKEWPKDGPKLLWSAKTPEAIGAGYGTPAVVGDKLYVIGADGNKNSSKELVTCLSARDGGKVWQTALTTTSGNYADRWGGGPRSTPTTDGDRLYALGATGDLVCLSTADGKEVWRKNLVSDFGGKVPNWGYSESPLIDGNKVVVTPGAKGGVAALDKKTGETVWVCKELSDGAGYSSLIPTEVGGTRLYVQQTMLHAVGIRANDGKLLFQVGEIGRQTAVIPTPVVVGDIAFFTAGYGAGCEAYKLAPDGPGGVKAQKIYSKNKVVENHHGGVIEFGGHVYGHSNKAGWVCFDYKTGPDDPVWANQRFAKGSIAFADGYFFCYSETDGALARIKATPTAWEEAGRFTIPATSKLRVGTQGKVWPHPVIANGKLYLRDYELLYCYDLGGTSARASR